MECSKPTNGVQTCELRRALLTRRRQPWLPDFDRRVAVMTCPPRQGSPHLSGQLGGPPGYHAHGQRRPRSRSTPSAPGSARHEDLGRSLPSTFGARVDENLVGAARGVRIVTWAISRNPLRPGALVTAGDVCHLHPDRAAAERCGALMGGAPDLVRLEKHTARVYRVLWSLSDVAGGELRKPAPPPAPPPEKRPDAVRSWPGNVRISGPVAARAAWERLTGGDP